MNNLITLTRTHSTPDSTIGTLCSADNSLTLSTLEARLPTDHKSYVSWLLPPGTYEAHVERCPINYKGMTITGYWLFFAPIHNYPRAGFFCLESMLSKYACIKVATDVLDPYNLVGYDDAAKHLSRWCKRIYDTIGNDNFSIDIIQDMDTITFSEMNEFEYRNFEIEQEQEHRRQQLIEELFGPSSTSPQPLSLDINNTSFAS